MSYLPDELERIRAHHPDSSPEINLARLRGDPIVQQESKAYLLRDVIIADGTVMSRTARVAITGEKRRPVLWDTPANVSEGALCSTFVTERYFGHWLQDGLSHEQWTQERGLQPLVLRSPPARIHERGYRELAGMWAKQVAQARVDRLWYLVDHEWSDDRIRRLKLLRERIRRSVPRDGPTHVFLSRGSSGVGRVLANEDDLRTALKRRGFTLLDPEGSTPAEIARALASARIVVSPEGSAVAHAMMAMPEHARLLILQPPLHFNMPFKTIADALDIHFGFTVGDVVDPEAFVQPVDRLERLLDLVERSPADR